MRKRYNAYGCKAELDQKTTYMLVTKTNVQDADFFGVYEVQEDGTENWIADFLTWDDAQMFALEKEKEEIK